MFYIIRKDGLLLKTEAEEKDIDKSVYAFVLPIDYHLVIDCIIDGMTYAQYRKANKRMYQDRAEKELKSKEEYNSIQQTIKLEV